MTADARRGWWTLLLAVGGGALAVYCNLRWMSVVRVDDAWLPVSHDSFYHARRILDAVADLASYYQFDPRIHAPEGSWLTWPWAYDFLLAVLVRAGMSLSGVQDPMAVLVVIPPLCAPLNVLLLIGIARRLSLTPPLQALAVAAFVLLPLTQMLYGAGVIDHHYVEQLFVMLTLYLGLRWFGSDGTRRDGAWLGLALGAAPAFHAGLFILQLPVLAGAFLCWLRGTAPDGARAAAFSLSLLLSTLVFLLPSEPFRLVMSEYYLHSWFHLYCAACSAFAILFMARWRRTTLTLAVLTVAGLLLLAGIANQLDSGMRFVAAGIPGLEDIIETMSLPAFLDSAGIRAVAAVYSWLVVPVLPVLAWYLYRLLRPQPPQAVFFAVMVIFGSALLLLQRRFHYFGSFALVLPVLLLAQQLLREAAPWRRRAGFALAAVLAVTLFTTLDHLTRAPLLGRTLEYRMTSPMFPALRQACAESPGIVLAQPGDGHHIRFHTDCSVIANNFILTPQHVAKLQQAHALLAGTAAALVAGPPWLEYVYVTRMDNVFDVRDWQEVLRANAGVRAELLLGGERLPPGYTLLAELLVQSAVEGVPRTLPLARLFRIERPPPAGG